MKHSFIHLTEVTVSKWDGAKPEDLEYWVQIEPKGHWFSRMELYELDAEFSAQIDEQATEEAYEQERRKVDLYKSLSREKLN